MEAKSPYSIISSVVRYIKKHPAVLKIAAVLAVGIVLIIIGSVTVGGVNDASATTEEERLAEMCESLSGVGECRVMLTYDGRGGAVTSVAIVCKGAGRASVRAELTSMISSLYGIGSNRIYIAKMR